MKSKFDLRHNIGKIKVENLDDLYILNSILQEGDLVKGKTSRSIEVRRGDKKVKVGRKTINLKISIEKKELSDTLRLGGKIVEGPEDITRGYHSLEIKPGLQLTIERVWKRWEIDKIKEASIKVDPVLICILDDSEADFYLLKNKSSHLFHIKSGGSGKATGDNREGEYFGKVVAEIKRNLVKYLVVAGPGFTKDNIKDKLKDLDTKIFYDSCSHTGTTGLQEILKRGAIENIIKSSREVEEINLVEKLLEEMAKEGKAVYGLKETKSALEQGAVETLLISDKKVRELEKFLNIAEKVNTKVVIISSEHQSGEKLFRLGGIAGLLRYKLYS